MVVGVLFVACLASIVLGLNAVLQIPPHLDQANAILDEFPSKDQRSRVDAEIQTARSLLIGSVGWLIVAMLLFLLFVRSMR